MRTLGYPVELSGEKRTYFRCASPLSWNPQMINLKIALGWRGTRFGSRAHRSLIDDWKMHTTVHFVITAISTTNNPLFILPFQTLVGIGVKWAPWNRAGVAPEQHLYRYEKTISTTSPMIHLTFSSDTISQICKHRKVNKSLCIFVVLIWLLRHLA